MNTEKCQLELGFDGAGLRSGRRERRLARAHWWFEQMHAMVDRALEWPPTPPPSPEQTRICLANAD